jgi:hypothetical protein
MIAIYTQSVRHSEPDPQGARLTVIGEKENLAYEGSPSDCADYLARLPLGISVAVRHAGGIRSCMNKPSLWADVRAYQPRKVEP